MLLWPLVLPQVIPQPELEVWLGERVKFHAANRAALIKVLQTHLNGGRPVELREAVVSTWVETIDDPEPDVSGEGGAGD